MRAAAVLLVTGCALAPVDYVGKLCPANVCPASLVCVAGVCQLDAGLVADAGAQGDGGEHFVAIELAGPADDAMWNGTRERLQNGDSALDVGPGSTAMMGARFAMPVPAGATLLDVHYNVSRATGDKRDDMKWQVRVWNSIAVPAFDETHVHPAELHAGAGYLAGSAEFSVDWRPYSSSGDLSALLQPLLNRPDWVSGSTIGVVVVAPAIATTWAGFDDYTATSTAVVHSQLTVRYRW